MQVSTGLLRALGTTAKVFVILFLCGLLLMPLALRFMSNNEVARPDTLTSSAGASDLRFLISGNVKGLWPGKSKLLRLRIKNRNAFAIRVLSLSVRAKNSDKPRCSARWIRANETKRLSLEIASGSRAAASYRVALAKNAPNSCQGARWSLRFGGTARKL